MHEQESLSFAVTERSHVNILYIALRDIRNPRTTHAHRRFVKGESPIHTTSREEGRAPA